MDINVEINDGTDEMELTEASINSLVRSVQTIASTEYGTIPLNRGVGVTGIPENNSPAARDQYAAEIIEQVDDWEDTIKAEEVTFEGNVAKVVLAYDGS